MGNGAMLVNDIWYVNEGDNVCEGKLVGRRPKDPAESPSDPWCYQIKLTRRCIVRNGRKKSGYVFVAPVGTVVNFDPSVKWSSKKGKVN